MFTYESLMGIFARWASNMAHPEVTILRSYADYEGAMLAAWRSPDLFSLSGIQKLDELLAEPIQARYQVQRQPVVPVAEVQLPQQQRCSSAPASQARMLALHFHFETYNSRLVISSTASYCLSMP
jgi:hypothetical protein